MRAHAVRERLRVQTGRLDHEGVPEGRLGDLLLARRVPHAVRRKGGFPIGGVGRSEEHTSELQSQSNLVCRLLLEKKKKNTKRKLTLIYQQVGRDTKIC